MFLDQEDVSTKQTSQLKTNLSGLKRYTNYSIGVAAFTSAGDGVKSHPVFCHTDEDGMVFLFITKFINVIKIINMNCELIYSSICTC